MIGAQEEHLVGVLFEIDDVALHLFARLHLEALGDCIEACHGKEQTPEERLRHLEVPVLFDVTNGEETLMAGDLLLEQLGIILFAGSDFGSVGLHGVVAQCVADLLHAVGKVEIGRGNRGMGGDGPKLDSHRSHNSY